MAKYNITNLNYIAVGEERCLINVDTQLDYEIYDYIHLLCAETGTSGYVDIDSKLNLSGLVQLSHDIGIEQGVGDFKTTRYIKKESSVPMSQERFHEDIILDELQDKYVEADSSCRKYIRLYLSCCTDSIRQRIRDFNDHRIEQNRTFVADNCVNDKNGLTCESGKIDNVYDITDISIKRLGVHAEKNSEFPETDTHFDMYAPEMTQKPLGFVQTYQDTDYFNDTLVMTSPTVAGPYVMRTDFISGQYAYSGNLGMTVPPIYTYMTSAESEQLSGMNRFEPVRNYIGPVRQYVIDMPVDSAQASFAKSGSQTKYDQGDMYYRRMHTAKSAYDPLYSMKLSSVDSIERWRDYCGFGVAGGKPYLKFYDRLAYCSTTPSVSAVSGDVLNIATISSNAETGSRFDSRTVPYQKIEMIYPSDYTADAKHKSNLFSVTILDTGIGELDQRIKDKEIKDDSGNIRRAVDRLKMDITNAVFEIAQNVSPANTQLFNVKFGD